MSSCSRSRWPSWYMLVRAAVRLISRTAAATITMSSAKPGATPRRTLPERVRKRDAPATGGETPAARRPDRLLWNRQIDCLMASIIFNGNRRGCYLNYFVSGPDGITGVDHQDLVFV